MKRKGLPDPERAARHVQRHARCQPRVGVVLGSGFGPVAQAMSNAEVIPYADIPGFPVGSVPGHAGCMVVGHWAGQAIAVLSGRIHHYEGFDWPEVTFGVRVLAALGIQDLLLTNAAGGLRRGCRPGDFMVVRDHINLMGSNPLRGPVATGRERFVDMTQAYDPKLAARLKQAARVEGIRMFEGVYLAVPGPSYETPAEIRTFARLGAQAVGMSTVPEAIVARQCGLRVAGLSCITNMAAGMAGPGQTVTHGEVLDVARAVSDRATRLVHRWLELGG